MSDMNPPTKNDIESQPIPATQPFSNVSQSSETPGGGE